MELGSSLTTTLEGRIIESDTQKGVTYELERLVGEGGMGCAYLAHRKGPEGVVPVVVKVIRPGLAGGEVKPELVALKESVALQRLNEGVAPTPFVVRFVDAGRVQLSRQIWLPWTAIEYVHGGVEGTTLEDRVTYSLHKTGHAFDSLRAAHAIRCIAAGLTAIHGASIIHRDLTPGNVLCCGFGESEIFKIADFGVARALGLELTFLGMNLGTPGYSAPEAASSKAGPHSDVFSFAALVYYMLTGQHYFDVSSPGEAIVAFASEQRASITAHAALSPDVAGRPAACRAIDAALARATTVAVAGRLESALEFQKEILAALGAQSAVPRSSQQLLSAVSSSRHLARTGEYQWLVRSEPRAGLVITSAAWDTDGHALALSADGAWFWNGQTFIEAPRVFARLPRSLKFTERHQAGGWLVGGDFSRLCVVEVRGVSASLDLPRADVRFSYASGHIDDLLVAVETRAGEPPTLWACSDRCWLEPLPLLQAARLTIARRLDDTRWIIAGQRHEGAGFSAVYSPLRRSVEALGPTEEFAGGASAPERCSALLVGKGGLVLRIQGETHALSVVPSEPGLEAAAVDIVDHEWAACAGKLFGRNAAHGEPWALRWHEPGWSAPFVSILADAGIVLAMTADGAIVEGRAV